MVSRHGTLRAAAAALVLSAGALFGACHDRYIDPHVSCDSGTCICVGGFEDCDEDRDNGCETDLGSDLQNCGACGNVCDNGMCSEGSCACSDGFADCDGSPSTGCEAQPASDPFNCGVCGHDCAGGLCEAGVCQPVTIDGLGLDGAKSLAVADGFVYVARCGDPAVAQQSTDGGAVTGIGMATGCASLVSVSSDTVFWAGEDKIVYSASLDFPADATQLAADTNPVLHFVAGPSHLYWYSDTALEQAIVRVRIDGTSMPQKIAATPSGIAMDATGAYWSDSAGIHLWPFDSTLVSDIDPLVAGLLAVNGDMLFAATPNEGIKSLPKAGGTVTAILPMASALAIAADETHVYWAEKSDGTVRRANRDGTDITALSKGEAFLGSSLAVPFALDDRAVYWVADGTVRKVAK